jgi:carboxypeptidase Taq
MAEQAGALGALKAKIAVIGGLGHAEHLLIWDQETQMPAGGTESRAVSRAAVSRTAHELATSEEYGDLLRRAEEELSDADPDSDDARLLWAARRRYDRDVRLPAELVARERQAAVLATRTWQAARAANDYASFAPHLDEIFSIKREMAERLGYDGHPYDALLDAYEPEMKTADVRRVFTELRERLAPLVRSIAERADAVDDSCLAGRVERDRQLGVARELTERLGYDYERGRMDLAPHPFAMPLAQGDVRITVRVNEDRFDSCFYAAAHECGHALYEQGVPSRFDGTPLRGSASLGVHESQSRLWENLVARGRPFLSAYYGRLQGALPEQLGSVDVEEFYRAVNKAEPSLIRVEADEVTYNLHIMLRFDLELALLEGSLDAAGLPAAWDEKLEEYLGIRADSQANGALQDIHWASGLVGYFPTYSLGNVMSAQLYDTAVRERPEIPELLGRGETGALLGWLRERVHAHGGKHPPQELLERATGSRLDAGPYLGHLNAKYGELYGL